ncbi:MAG TPA: SpoIIE family protein phosphatase, partial [Acidimicrobiia bacterium]|nr:SpoIIE family protein phosphatase [Acidimicrobiia bacterium]
MPSDPPSASSLPFSDPAGELLAAARFCVPDQVPGLVTAYARRAGALDAGVYLIDYEQRVLTPLPRVDGPERAPVAVEGTLAGRAFSTLDQQWSGDAGILWIPMVEGNERLGVVGYELGGPARPGQVDQLNRLTVTVAELVAAKSAYGEFFEQHRRLVPMSIASELAWQLLPPLTFGCRNLVISGILAPAYDLGGDSFDYGVDSAQARVAVFDAMGHGLEAGMLVTVAVAAYRNSRRRGLKLDETAAAIDEAVSARFGPER